MFLRVLDYYDGVLFLTTNRAGVLDEAFISRIHSKILYQDLTLEQTLDIWKINIQRVRVIDDELAKTESLERLHIDEQELLNFAAFLFKQGSTRGRSHGRWNGRQIRNAFQVARSLAYYEHHRSGRSGPPVLGVHHFKTMHEITTSFDEYLAAVRGGTAAELAHEAEYRYDPFENHLTRRQKNAYAEEYHKLSPQSDATLRAGETNPYNPNVEVRATLGVAVSDRAPERPRLEQHLSEGDETLASPGDNLPPSHQHRDSESSMSGIRHRSNSYLSAPEGHSASPPTRDMMTDARFRSSPRPSLTPARDSQEFPANYIAATSPRAGFGEGFIPTGANPYQYGSSPRTISGMGAAPRGVSSGMFDEGVSAGREYGTLPGNYKTGGYGFPQQRQEYYGPASGTALPEQGREGPGRHRGGSVGFHWNSAAGGRGGGGQYGGDGRETDLTLD